MCLLNAEVVHESSREPGTPAPRGQQAEDADGGGQRPRRMRLQRGSAAGGGKAADWEAIQGPLRVGGPGWVSASSPRS